MILDSQKYTCGQLLFVTDLDNTLVPEQKALKHDQEALKDAQTALQQLNQELDNHRKECGTKIVYATGRSFTLYKQLTAEQSLLEPDALITSVGTEIHFDPNTDKPDSEWSKKLSFGWDRKLVADIAAKFPELVPQQQSEQGLFKSSYFISEQDAVKILPQLKFKLENNSLKFNLIYSGGKDLDILPLYADKGLAVKFLQQKWEVDSYKTVVCGDSGNDIGLFSAGEERGIIVGNARKELLKWYEDNCTDYRYLAKARYAAGVLEGLQYFNFI